MANTMTCPLCRREHPASTTYCPNYWAEIPAAPPEPPRTESAMITPTAPALASSAERVTCPECGFTGTPGAECPQCGFHELPRDSSMRTASFQLPSGQVVSIPRGRDVVIGRQSDIAGIRHGLEPFDAVSRRHCCVSISPAGDKVTVRDPGSANHTWVGDDPAHVEPDEIRVASLPVRLRLGQHVTVTISGGGPGA